LISEQVISRAKNYDSEALTEICEYYYSKIYNYIFYKVSTREDTEDLTHEVFVKMVKNITTLQGNIESWLYTIARNLIIDYYRKRENSKLGTAMTQEYQETETDFTEYVSGEDLRRQLQKLPQEQQDVVIYKFINDFSNKQIADFLGKTEGAIKSLQFRAVRSLRKMLSKGEKWETE